MMQGDATLQEYHMTSLLNTTGSKSFVLYSIHTMLTSAQKINHMIV